MASDVRAKLANMGAELAEEQQVAGLKCPFCEGGSKNEKTFSIKREGFQIQYICHRASCNRKGMCYVGPATDKIVAETEISPFRRAVKGLIGVPADIVTLLQDKYNYNTTDIARLDAKWSPSMSRLWMPILTSERVVLGGTLRTFKEDEKPKTYTFVDNFSSPVMSFYKCWNTSFKRIVIVEDQLSACRAANTASAVALCGTNINLPGIRTIAALEPEHVVFCLDGDAFALGLSLQKKWGGMFKKCTVAKPPSDLKDMSRLHLQDFLNTTFGV